MPCNAKSDPSPEPAEMSVILTVSNCLATKLKRGSPKPAGALKESGFDKGWMQLQVQMQAAQH